MKSWWKSKFGTGGRDDSDEEGNHNPEITSSSSGFNIINGYFENPPNI